MLTRLSDRSWAPGEIIPSEHVLSAEFGVSQGTVRKALDELTTENLLIRVQGRGTFVAEHTTNRSLFHFLNLVDNNYEKQTPHSRLIDMQLHKAEPNEAASLDIDVGEMVVRIYRNRYLNNKPVVTEQISIPWKLTPGLENFSEDLPNTLYQLYEKRFGFSVTRAREWLTAVKASKAVAAALSVEEGSPMLSIRRVAYTYNSQPVELRISICNTSHHMYLSELT